VLRIALNLLRSRLRRERLRRWLLRRGSADLAPQLVGQAHDPDAPDQLEEMREARRVLAHLLALLPARQREPFLLKHLEGMSYEEISEILGVSQGALKVRVHRARERLAREALALGLKPQRQLRRSRGSSEGSASG